MAAVAWVALGCPEPDENAPPLAPEADAQVELECAAHTDCDDSVDCTLDLCGIDGTCSHVTQPNHCSDSDPCNGAELCVPDAGGCQAGEPLLCGDGNPCNGDEVCLPQTGCVAGVPVQGCCTDDPACDDGDACNGTELCDPSGHTCKAGPPLGCDDGDVCNGVETCHPAVGCQSGSELDCDDGDLCNGDDACEPGVGCVDGTPLECEDDNPCTGGESCEPDIGCVPGIPPDGCCTTDADCDDGAACNGVETCNEVSNTCLFGAPLACDNGNLCDGLEVCDEAVGGCATGVALNCNDDNPCTDDICDPLVEGCVNAPNTAACDDKNPCTTGDFCEERFCIPGLPTECGDGDACNGDEGCDPAIGCIGAEPPDCDDANPCTNDWCDTVKACQYLANTIPCEDGSQCTLGDACQDAACVAGTPLDCADDEPCTVDTCDPTAGCTHLPAPALPPEVTLAAPLDGAILGDDVSIVVETAGPAALATSALLNGAPWPLADPITAEGQHTLVVSVDGCGETTAQATATFHIDKGAPELTVSLDPPANAKGWSNLPTTVSWSATDTGSAIASVSEPTLLDEPSPAVEVAGTATDTAGNTTTLTTTLKLDFKPPIVSITSPVLNQPDNDQVVVGEPTILVTGTVGPDAGSGFADGRVTSSRQTEKLPIDAPGAFEVEIALREGVNTIIASATDHAGNVGTASVCVILDHEPPHVFVQSPGGGATTTAETVDVAGLAHDLVVGAVTEEDVTVTVNGVAAAVKSGHFVALDVPLAPGQNTVTATATDFVGHVATHSVTLTRIEGGSRLVVVSGDQQTAMIGATLGAPLVVRMEDPAGQPIGGKAVVFTVTENDATIDAAVALAKSPRQRGVVVQTDEAGLAQATLTLGSRAGAGLNRVTVSAADVPASVVLQATGEPAAGVNIHAHAGLGQVGTAGEPLPMPLAVIVTDAGHNPVDGMPVTFTVVQGDGKLGGSTAVTVVTNAKGFADVVFAPGEETGYSTHAVEASIPTAGDGSSATELGVRFTASAFSPRNPDHTAVRGVVTDENEAPLPGVTIRFPAVGSDPHGVVTDPDGHFTFFGAPPGFALMEVDGTTAVPAGAGWSYPKMVFEVHNVPGIMNTMDRPVFLLKLNQGTWVDGLTDTTLTLPEMPGFELSIPAGTTLTFPDGAHEGVLSVTQVHFDQAPMAPLNGLQSNLLVTIQPPGVHFEPPAPLQLPNVDAYPAGSKVDMYSYDHELEAFVAIGLGTVSDDGTVVRSDPGVGVVKGGWHCGSNPNPQADCRTCADPVAELSATPILPEDDGGLGVTDPPLIPVTDIEFLLHAAGVPGAEAHWEWCASGDFEVSGDDCAGLSTCQAIAASTSGTLGAVGKVKVVHICDSTGEQTSTTLDLVVCNVLPVLEVEESDFDAGLPVQFWADSMRSRLELLGCGLECKVVCGGGLVACGHECVPLEKRCDDLPGNACNEAPDTPEPAPPMTVEVSSTVSQRDACCPGCPNQVEAVGTINIQAEAGFGDECDSPKALPVVIEGYESLVLQLDASFTLATEATLHTPFNNCCPEPPCACYEGTASATGIVTGSIEAVAGLAEYGLASVHGNITSGITSELVVGCDSVCGKVSWGGLSGPLTFTTLTGAVLQTSVSFTFIEPIDLVAEQCWPLTLPDSVPVNDEGCPEEPPEVGDPACGEVAP